MNDAKKTRWRIKGEAIVNCNCDWGCPCQFNALPTTGNCEALLGFEIHDGYFNDTRLDGLRVARIFWWPGPIHEGNGVRQIVIDKQATVAQREALLAIESGTHGGKYFEIFAAVCPNVVKPIFAPITVDLDRVGRRAAVRIDGIAESRTEPIKNPVTGDEHRARIVLPDGFEFQEAEMGNTVSLQVQSGGKLVFQHANCYAQLNVIDWGNES